MLSIRCGITGMRWHQSESLNHWHQLEPLACQSLACWQVTTCGSFWPCTLSSLLHHVRGRLVNRILWCLMELMPKHSKSELGLLCNYAQINFKLQGTHRMSRSRSVDTSAWIPTRPSLLQARFQLPKAALPECYTVRLNLADSLSRGATHA